jgi:hypothetical protein
MAKKRQAKSNPVGRPPIFTTANDLQSKCDQYFEYIKGECHEEETVRTSKDGSTEPVKITIWDRRPETPSLTGLAYFLGFESRQSIYDYEKDGEFSYTIKRARLRVEASYEQFLLTQASTGAIFALKNFGWKDKSEVEQTSRHYFIDDLDESNGDKTE